MATNKFKFTLQVTSTFEVQEPPSEDNASYFYGLFLEGASWDPLQRMLVESTSTSYFEKFPVVKVVVEKLDDDEDGVMSVFDELDHPKLSAKENRQLEEIERLNEELFRSAQQSALSRQTSLDSPSKSERSSSALHKDGSAKNFNFIFGADLNHPASPGSRNQGPNQVESVQTSQLGMIADVLHEKDESLSELGSEAPQKTYTYRCPVFKVSKLIQILRNALII